MFQNIADVDINGERIRNNSNSNVVRLKEIFKYQNIIIYILTLMMSTLSIKNEITPFGLAMVAACIGESIPLILVYIMAIVGTFIGSGISGVGNFVVTSIVYFILVLFFRAKVAVDERNEAIKTGGKLFAANIIVSIVKSITGVFLFYDVFMAIISSSIIYVFYKIFVNGLSFIKDFNIKKAFTLEELIAGVLIIAIAGISFNHINIFSLNISNIIIIFMIMLLGWQNGMVIGALSGSAIGLAISFIDGTSFIQITMFAISGILSGLLNKFGKGGVIVGFILGNAIITYWVRGASSVILYFREIFIASIGLLLVPKKVKIEIEDLIGKTKLIDSFGDRRLKEAENTNNEEVSEKLKALSKIFSNIENTREVLENKENFIQDFLDNLEEIQANTFYDLIANEDNGIAKEICETLIQNDIIIDKDLEKILNNHNNFVVMRDASVKNDFQEIVKIANRTLKTSQINKAKAEERKKSIGIVNENIKQVTKVIDDCAKKITEKKVNVYSNKEQELAVLIKSKNIKLENCRIRKLKNEKYIVELKLDYNNLKLSEKETIINISEMISKTMKTKIVLQRERRDEEKKEYYQIYSSEDKFILQVGSSKIAKDGNEISGDCNLQIKLADGKYLLAIADGMGSGEKARECSRLTLKLVKQMLAAGFDKEQSVKMINSRLNLTAASDIYSTLDICILDLFVGKIELLKNGACNTYIKRENNIIKVESKDLPIGQVNDIEVTETTFELADGDIIVICSDGIIDSKGENERDWLEKYIKDVNTNNVQRIADYILAESIDNSFGVAHDDMTVIVSKVVKRK